MQLSIGTACNPQWNKTSHHNSGHQFSYRKIGYRERATGINKIHRTTDKTDDHRNHAASRTSAKSQSRPGRQIYNSKDQGASWRDISINQNRIARLNIIFLTVCPLNEVKIIIQSIHRALKKYTGSQKYYSFIPRKLQPLLPAIKITKQCRKYRSYPCVGRRQIQCRFQCQGPVPLKLIQVYLTSFEFSALPGYPPENPVSPSPAPHTCEFLQ